MPVNLRRLLQFRVTLGVAAVTPILLIGFFVSLMYTLGAEKALKEAVSFIGANSGKHVITEINQYLHVPVLINELNADDLLSGRIDSNEMDSIRSLLISRLKDVPSISSIYFGNPRGGLIDAGREGAGGELYTIETEGFAAGKFKKIEIDDKGVKGRFVSELPDFDSRTRVWYKTAIRAEGAAWVPPFELFTGQDRAVSAVLPVYENGGKLLGVFSIDIFLSQLESYLTEINERVGGICYITDMDGSLIASSRGAESELISVINSILFSDSNEKKDSAEQDGYIVESDEKSYHLTVEQIGSEYGLDWQIIIAYPEDVFSNQLRRYSNMALILIAAVTVLSILLSILIGYLINKPVKNIIKFASGIEHNDSIEIPATIFIEFHALQETLINMRSQLNESISALNIEVSEKDRALEQVRDLLSENKLLLKETHHRVKNNLSMIISLLSLQAAAQDNPQCSEILADSISRIRSMMVLYDKLYKKEKFNEEDAAEYLENVTAELSLHLDPGKRIEWKNDFESVNLTAEQLVPLGIITTEIITNSFKYAFTGRAGRLTCHLYLEDKNIVFSIADDGAPMTDDQPQKQGFGMTLVEVLAAQLSGTVTIDSSEGFRFSLVFPLNN